MACLRYVMVCGYMFSSCRLILSMTHLIEGIAKFYSANNFKDGNCREVVISMLKSRHLN